MHTLTGTPLFSEVWQLFLLVALGFGGLVTLAGFFGLLWWAFDLTSHFRVQLGLGLAGLAILAVLSGRQDLAVWAGGLALINLGVVAPLYRTSPAPTLPGGRRRRLLLGNVYQPNQAYDRVRELAEQLDPDWVVLIETNQDWISALAPLEAHLPYRSESLRDDHYGMVLYSRFPIVEQEIKTFSETGIPSLVVRVVVDGQPLTIVVSHPPPPKGKHKTMLRNRQLAALSCYLRAEPGPLLLCGDLNTSPWSPHFRRLLADSGLRDSAQGFGPQATWPAWLSVLGVPIDHVLLKGSMVVDQRRVGPSIGSDHRPVWVDLYC